MKSPISRARRAAIRLTYIKELSRFETALATRIAKIIASQGAFVAKWYRMGHELNPDLLVNHKQPFYALLVQYYRQVTVTFYEKLQNSLKRSIFEDALQAWLTREALDTVDEADDTTMSVIKNIVRNGLANNLTRDQIASAIEDATDEDNAYARANVIARTEMHSAMNFAQLTAAKDTKLTLVKVWTASLDSRTRDSHADADGQTVGIDEDFTVDGENVSRPGDGSTENSVNCRCCMIFSKISASDSDSNQ